ncbi:MAG: [Fe-Fe] hydrogenase large subunit C-terminal domain-containing protein [Phycisphaerae bacterium]
MIEIEIDGKTTQAHRGEMLLDVLRRAGVHVPTLCHVRDVQPAGACRLCVVEVEGRPELVPSCATPVQDGMKVRSSTPRVLRSRKTIVELLLAGHAADCLYCVRNGRCELGGLAEQMDIRERLYGGASGEHPIDSSSPAVVRDANKCVLCGRCVRVCREVQGVGAIDFIGRGPDVRVGANGSSCVNCGQCAMVCPTGALREQSHIKEVINAIADPNVFTVVQYSPPAVAALAAELGLKAGAERGPQGRYAACGDPLAGTIVAVLRKLGFDRVFDTALAADLAVMETAAELAGRLERGERLPVIAGCSPSCTMLVEQSCPDLAGCLSSSKSPQQMMGAIAKDFCAAREGVDPGRVFSVAVAPCAAKKPEVQRIELLDGGVGDVDAVLTARELARIIRMKGLDVTALAPDGPDTPFGEPAAPAPRTAGRFLGAWGGMMEAVLKTAHYMMAGRELSRIEVKDLRGLKGVRHARAWTGRREIGAAAVSGLGNARALLEEIRPGRQLFGKLQFIEVLACPGGCIATAVRPHGGNGDGNGARSRAAALFRIDREEPAQPSHASKAVQRLYAGFLGKPLGEVSRRLLHTDSRRMEGTQ